MQFGIENLGFSADTLQGVKDCKITDAILDHSR